MLSRLCPAFAGLLLLCVLPVSIAAAAAQAPPAADQTLPLKLRPYRVLVALSVIRDTGARPISDEALDRELQAALHRMYGRMWRLRMQPAEWLAPGRISQILRLRVSDFVSGDASEELTHRYTEADTEKVMLVAIRATAAGFRMVCREYDVRTQDLSPAREQTTPDPRLVASRTARLIRDSFRPYLEYVRQHVAADGATEMQLQVQAGEIAAPDPEAEQIREGDVLRPFQRYMNRLDPTKVKRLRQLPLTYLQVTSVDEDVTRGLVTGVLLTHGPVTPFGIRGRSLEQVALRQRPAAASSRLRLVERSAEQPPLASQRVSVVFKLRLQDSDQKEQLRIVSNRNGELTISTDDEFPTVWLYIYSGQVLLARVPYAPGLIPLDTLILPDDSIRLSVEGDLQLFRDELVDAVALREVYLSMAARAAEEGRSDDVKQHLQDYGKVPRLDTLQESLSLIRVAALNRADAEKNLRARRAVENMCRKMGETLELFFDEETRVRRQDAVKALRLKIEQ